MPERSSRTHVVPGNIMSVEFKLFDFMTLKQFLYLVVCAFLSYIFITILPDSFFKYLIPTVIMIMGVIIAFVQFNGESFASYTTNFILGVIQPQRRVWSKTPVINKSNISSLSDSALTKKALNSVAERFVTEEEVIPVDYNKTTSTDVDLLEQTFLKSTPKSSARFASSVGLSTSDLSKLNFASILSSQVISNLSNEKMDEHTEINVMSSTNKSDIIDKGLDNKSLNIDNSSGTIKFNLIDTNLNINTSIPMNPVNNSNNDPFKNHSAPTFTINMDNDDDDINNKKSSESNISPSDSIGTQFVPLAQDISQHDRAEGMPSVNIDMSHINNGKNNDISKQESATQELESTELNSSTPINSTILQQSDNPSSNMSIEPQVQNNELQNLANNVINSTNQDTTSLNNAPIITEPVREVQTSFGGPSQSSVAPIPVLDITNNQLADNHAAISKNNPIHGKIISADLKSMANIAIIMFDTEGSALESTVTNEHGEFVFSKTPRAFEIKIHSGKKFLFSPIDKVTKEIIIHELPTDPHSSGFTGVFKTQIEDTHDVTSLDNADEMETSDTKIPNTINGVVKDGKGHYLAGVLVSIKDSNGTIIRALATNPLGQFFSLSPLPNGEYVVNFEKDGIEFEAYKVSLEGQVYSSKIYIGKNKNINEI